MNTSAITDARAPVHAVPASQSDIDPTHRDANQLMAIQNLVDGPVGNGAGEPRPAPATAPAHETVRVAEESAKPKQAAPEKAKPKGKQIRAVAVPKVRGAPGKGNSELTIAMRDVLKKAGWPVRSTPSDDTLTIRGVVKVGKGSKGQQDVVLAWKLVDPNGNVLGTIKQANKVPEGSINSGFGPNAKHAAQAAASGIFDLIEKVKRKQG